MVHCCRNWQYLYRFIGNRYWRSLSSDPPPVPVPAPSTIILLGIGLLGLPGAALSDPRDLSILRKFERTRQNILDTALRFLWSNTFRDLTVASLTMQAGVSRTCYYQYFADLHMATWMELGDEPMVLETPPNVIGFINVLRYVSESNDPDHIAGLCCLKQAR